MTDWDWLISILSKRSEDHQQPQNAAAEDDPGIRDRNRSQGDSEFEYEYDESETETFFVNVDLNSSGWRGITKAKPIHEAATARRVASPKENIPQSEESPVPEPAPIIPTNSDELDSIHILDLHHDHPIVKYQNQVFECSWANMVGTELLFIKPDAEFEGPVLKQGEGYKLIAANSVKLISQRLSLTDRHDEPSSRTGATALAVPESSSDNFLTPVLATELQAAQTMFLRRLTAIKGARGERGFIPSHNQLGIKARNKKSPRKVTWVAGVPNQPTAPNDAEAHVRPAKQESAEGNAARIGEQSR